MANSWMPAKAVRDRYGISDMTLWRWLQSEDMNFPRPMVINRRRFFKAAEIEAWEKTRVAYSLANSRPKQTLGAHSSEQIN